VPQVDQDSPLEKRLLALERRGVQVERLAELLRVRIIALLQNLWDDVSPFGVVTNTCTASYSGTLHNCAGVAWTGQTITITDSTGSVTLGMATTDGSGNFSGSVTIMSPSQMVLLNVNVGGYATVSKTLSCGSNTLGTVTPSYTAPAAPTINTLSNLSYCGDPGAITVNLSGITDGNSGTQLPLVVTALSSNTGQIPTPSVSYTSPNTTGSITFTPVAGLSNCGAPASISVKVQNAANSACGPNSKTVSFTVTVKQPVTPTLNNIADIGPFPPSQPNQTVTLSGISPGACNTSGSLSVTATSSNPTTSGVVSTSYTNPSSTGTVTVSIGATGTATISVTVTDANGTNCHSSNTITKTFHVTVR